MIHFGLGSLTGSGFPGESAGTLTHHDHWKPISQATLSYGYGLSVTPLQLAQAYAIIGNNGVGQPISLIALDEAGPGEQLVSGFGKCGPAHAGRSRATRWHRDHGCR